MDGITHHVHYRAPQSARTTSFRLRIWTTETTGGSQNCTWICKRYISRFLFGICRLYGSGVELAVDYAALKGTGNEIIVKELVFAGNNVIRPTISRVPLG